MNKKDGQKESDVSVECYEKHKGACYYSIDFGYVDNFERRICILGLFERIVQINTKLDKILER